jgi:hypothetical protein
VPVCAQCGTENSEVAKFCLACGSPLVAAPPAYEYRKVVTIVFSDLKGSTAMGEKLDSESLREVMTRYFDSMRAELERHGGVVEKFIGRFTGARPVATVVTCWPRHVNPVGQLTSPP